MTVTKISKKEAIATLRTMGLTKFSKQWKHSQRYYKVAQNWVRTKQERLEDKNEWGKINNFIRKNSLNAVNRVKKDKDGYIEIIGCFEQSKIPKKPKLYTCAKCGNKYPDYEHVLGGQPICPDCFKLWVKAQNSYALRWLKGQGEAFVFR
jgi:tRNA(Ile)-lysidine synthase TilS/MesJ